MGVNPWPQSGATDPTGTPTTDFNPLVSYPSSTNIPDVGAGFADTLAQVAEEILGFAFDLPALILEVLGGFLDSMCSMFTGNPTSGSTTDSFASGTQSAMDGLCGIGSGQQVGGTTGSSMIAGAQGAIGSGSNLLVGDPNAITSGYGLIDGGTNLANLLCGMCSGSSLGERLMDMSPRAREWASERLGVPNPVGSATPNVSGASLLAGIQGYMGLGSAHLTGSTTEITTGTGLVNASQGKLDTVGALVGLPGIGNQAHQVITQGAQYQADALAIAGQPVGLGTGAPQVVSGLFGTPILAPAAAAHQDLIDKLHQGLTVNDLSTGHSTADIANAASLLLASVNDTAVPIAQDTAASIALQAINNPAYHAIDPTLEASFDLTSVTGSSPSLLTVTQANTVMCFRNIQTTATKRSFALFAGIGLSGLTAVYLNVYGLSASGAPFPDTFPFALGVPAIGPPIWSSSNVLSFIPSEPDWVYITIGTPFLAQQASWVVMELQVVGGGALQIAGLPNHWLTPNPSVCPQQIGAQRVPNFIRPVNDGVGTGYTASTTTTTVGGSTTYTATAGDAVVVSVAVQLATGVGGASTFAPRTCTYGGAAMTPLGAVNADNSGQGWLELFGILDVPGGPKPIVYATTGTGTCYNVQIEPVSYPNCVGFGTAVTNFGSSTTLTSGVIDTPTNQKVVQAFMAESQTLAATGSSFEFNGTALTPYYNANIANGAHNLMLTVGAEQGSTILAFSETIANTAEWASISVPLLPAADPTVPPSISPIVYSSNIPWLGLSSENAQAAIAPLVYTYDVAGTYNLSDIPSWVGIIDVVAIGGGGSAGGGGGGSTAGGTTLVTVGGNPALIAAGGVGLNTTSTGASPGVFTYNGIDYQGGSSVAAREPGQIPGGGEGGKAVGLTNTHGGMAGLWAAQSYSASGISSVIITVGNGAGSSGDGAVWVILRVPVGASTPTMPMLSSQGVLSATALGLQAASPLTGSGALSVPAAFPQYQRPIGLPGNGVLSAMTSIVFPPTLTTETTAGSYTFTVPNCNYVDVVLLGGGGASGYGDSGGAAFGGAPGTFSVVTLTVGVDVTMGQTISGVVGHGGTIAPGGAGSGFPGGTGASTTATATGWSGLSASGGRGGMSWPYSSGYNGGVSSPGTETFNGQPYAGGATAATSAVGNAPGGGAGPVVANGVSKVGAPGAAWFYCY